MAKQAHAYSKPKSPNPRPKPQGPKADTNTDTAGPDHDRINRETEERWAKAEADASAATAFDLAGKLGMIMVDIEYLNDALHTIALALEGDEERLGRALLGISNGIETHLQDAIEKRDEISHRLWSYKIGKRREPVGGAS